MHKETLLHLPLASENDVVVARQRARQIAELAGFNRLDQVQIATAVSEIARNAFRYAQGGEVEFSIEMNGGENAAKNLSTPPLLVILIRDRGPGIADLDAILEGRYQSTTGMGMGIAGTKRLMDSCEIITAPGKGVSVTLKKYIPAAIKTGTTPLAQIAPQLLLLPKSSPFAEIQRQNQELLQTLAELRERQQELLNVTYELEDTNRGVVALYAEVDEKAEDLRRADKMKSRFLSNMSHEFRTPLGSIRALAQLLLDEIDGPLTAEQNKQVTFIKRAADDLAELVNDLLDLAKIEAGKVEVKSSVFSLHEMFSALRGMLRPLLVNDSVELTFTVEAELETLQGDEAKVSQILRNFISNALKFTPSGKIAVSVRRVEAEAGIEFAVADTGIGIAAENLDMIFDEFSQLENVLQSRVRGTGLGLPLCRQLAKLLNGYITVESAVGEGSTFRLFLRDAAPSVPQQKRSAGESRATGERFDAMSRDTKSRDTKSHDVNH